MKKSNNVATTATKITKGQAVEMINNLPNGRYFNVICKTQGTENRVMTAQKKAGASDMTAEPLPNNATPAQKAAHTRKLNGYITVWDVFADGTGGWRVIDGRTIKTLKCNKQTYTTV